MIVPSVIAILLTLGRGKDTMGFAGGPPTYKFNSLPPALVSCTCCP